uniref:Uncharacterized protein n=1 Tax=Meloidogyne enterolobii TaxID=390850 RepID=A0A6V7TWW5_MELEN|nr:unnamed protein product [Meloidogyne enterolobii]
MSVDILIKFDYFACLLIGFPLNIILIILIIFKTPNEMKTHSQILIQNCVLDILMLTVQMLLQMFYIIDTDGLSNIIFTGGILFNYRIISNRMACHSILQSSSKVPFY